MELHRQHLPYITAFILGVVSGTISALLSQFAGPNGLYWFPGLAFGVFFATYVYYPKKQNREEMNFDPLLRFIPLSTAAYWLATRIFMYSEELATFFRRTLGISFKSLEYPIESFLAGISGAAMLILITCLCSQGRVSLRDALPTIVAGGILGLFFTLGQFALFISWQSVIFLLLFRMHVKLQNQQVDLANCGT